MVLPNGQFRLVFTPKDYEASVVFYRDGLKLPIDHDWDYGGGDRGTVFVAGSGMIELLGAVPGSQYEPPQGVNVLIQVDDADKWFQLARDRELSVVQEPTSFPWGHRIVRLIDPNGLIISLFATIQK